MFELQSESGTERDGLSNDNLFAYLFRILIMNVNTDYDLLKVTALLEFVSILFYFPGTRVFKFSIINTT